MYLKCRRQNDTKKEADIKELGQRLSSCGKFEKIMEKFSNIFKKENPMLLKNLQNLSK